MRLAKQSSVRKSVYKGETYWEQFCRPPWMPLHLGPHNFMSLLLPLCLVCCLALAARLAPRGRRIAWFRLSGRLTNFSLRHRHSCHRHSWCQLV